MHEIDLFIGSEIKLLPRRLKYHTLHPLIHETTTIHNKLTIL